MATGISNPRCYASSLCDCSKKASREHYVSRAVMSELGSAHVISGASWLGRDEESKPLPAKALTSKVLCKRHNELLSPIDAAVIPFFRTLLRAFSVLESGLVLPSHELTISGDDLQLWLLKSLCGFLSSGEYAPGGVATRMDIPTEWIQLLFSGAQWNGGAGMHIRVVEAHPHRGFALGHVADPDTGELVGGVLEYCGVEFFILPTEGIGQVLEASADEVTKLIYRPGEILVTNQTHRTRIGITWKDWTPTSGVSYSNIT